jgi:hypothetical protein
LKIFSARFPPIFRLFALFKNFILSRFPQVEISCARLLRIERARFSRDEMKNLSRLSLIYERASRRAAPASDAFGVSRLLTRGRRGSPEE